MNIKFFIYFTLILSYVIIVEKNDYIEIYNEEGILLVRHENIKTKEKTGYLQGIEARNFLISNKSSNPASSVSVIPSDAAEWNLDVIPKASNEEQLMELNEKDKKNTGLIENVKISKSKNSTDQNKNFIDSIKVNKKGEITANIKIGYTIKDVIDDPILINNCLILCNKKNEILRLNGTDLIIIQLDLIIMDRLSYYYRILSYKFIHFDAIGNIKSVGEDRIRIQNTDIKLEPNIENIFLKKGDSLMNVYGRNHKHLFKNTNYNILYLFTFFAVLVATAFLVLKNRRIKKMKIESKIENVLIYDGEYNGNPVTIIRNNKSLNFKEKGIMSCIYKERWLNNKYYVFAKTFRITDKIDSLIQKQFISKLIEIVERLNENGVSVNMNPYTVRVTVENNPIILDCDVNVRDWYSPESLKRKIGIQCQSENEQSFVFGLFIYFLYFRNHPFDKCVFNTFKKEINLSNAENVESIELDKIQSTVFTEVERNILVGNSNMQYMDDHDLFSLLVNSLKLDPTQRFSLKQIKNHPFFWSYEKIFNFISNLSDKIECKDSQSQLLYRRLEKNKNKIFKNCWVDYLDKEVVAELCIHRIYNFNNVQGLLRAIRNKGRHYSELPTHIKNIYDGFPDGYMRYYTGKFSKLVMVCYISSTVASDEETLSSFY